MPLTTNTTKRLGLIVDWLAAGFQGDVLAGSWRAAEQRGANLLVFFGGKFQSADLSHPEDSIFHLARRPLLDGVVGVLCTLIEPLDGLQCGEALQSLQLPCVSVGLPLEGLSSFCVDNTDSMAELTGHLVEAHGYKRFAMIAASERSRESEARIRACRTTLEDYGLSLSNSQIARTGFTVEDGRKGAIELLDNRKLRLAGIDVLMCVNDLTAIGALSELSRRGIRVPDDIALTGFDGIEQTRYLTPALTTVAQPLEELGYRSALGVLQLLDGLEAPSSGQVDAALLVRNSCGCMESGGSSSDLMKRPRSPRGLAGLLPYRDVLGATLSRVAQGRLSAAGRGWEERWIMALLRDLQTPGTEFSQELQRTLRDVGTERAHLELCQRLLDTLRTTVLDQGVEPGTTRALENLMHEAQRLGSAAVERLEINRRITDSNTLYGALQSLEHSINKIGHEDFWRHLREALPRLGIRTCVVSRVYDARRSRLAFAMGEELEDDPAVQLGTEFATAALVPGHLFHKPRPSPFAARALLHEGRLVGSLVVSLTADDFAVYGPLASMIGLHLRLTA